MFDTKPHKAVLILEDNTKYYGWSFNNINDVIGEVIFNTGMTGYQETMTDPSYAGQIITFTYPELGNTGINQEDNESRKPFIQGIVAKNLCLNSSNWRASQSLIHYLKEHKIAHIYGIDTRALTKHLRSVGTMNGCISTRIHEISTILPQLQQAVKMEGTDIVQYVSTKISFKVSNLQSYYPIYRQKFLETGNMKISIIVIDFGTKYNILRCLQNLSKDINIHVVPAETHIQDIISMKPDGILLSNGPGDPSAVTYAIHTVNHLLKYKIPLFGICMGHQILSLSLGLETFKLQFGHRGLNHPTGYSQYVNITSQNHGFAVHKPDKTQHRLIIYETNYNDGTIASIVHREYPCFAVQYHPEASPGPHDTISLFEHFIKTIILIKQYPLLNPIH
uniref:Carbamoyl phosphate synthase small chain n=1 Tax=Hommersandiophycus borowitzkae TaxID=268573 RepID=A0A1G4NTZ6_9FLOR|nr:Carbamoyl phosphate synthase small subunit [Hommersandiophycus borowitzkae]SCW22084.1 Carbamoyl phosphate synthase small subunit [Hommersandiophycus borowitzkae]